MKKSKKYLISLIVISVLLAAVLAFDLFIIIEMSKTVWLILLGGVAIAFIASAIALVLLIIDIVLIAKYCQHKKRENNEAK